MEKKKFKFRFFIADRMKIVPNLTKKSKTEYETIFYYAKNALREKNALKPNLSILA